MILTRASLADRTGLWDVELDNGKVHSVTPHMPGSRTDTTECDLAGGLLHRTFVDAHLHLDKAFQTDTSPNQSGTLTEAIALGRLYKENLTGASVYQKVLKGARAALLNGTTRLRTHVDVDPTVGLAGVVAALEARSTLKGLVDVQVVAFPQEGITNHPGTADLLRESLRLGSDVIGGIPARDPDPAAHIRHVFALAESFAVPVDLHVDESDDPRDFTLPLVIEETRRLGFAGRVTAGHCCSLSAQEPARRAEVIQAMAETGIHALTLPSTNLYLQGRADMVNPRRGLLPVRELLAAGVNVAFGSDNVRDPFNPFGNASMVEGALIAAHAAHMGGTADLAEIFHMATTRSAALWESRRPDRSFRYLVEPGAPADLMVFDARTPQEVIVGQLPPVRVFAGGRQVVQRIQHIQLTESFPSW